LSEADLNLPQALLAIPTLEEQLTQQYGEWRSGTWNFAKGFATGIADTGISLVDGIGSIAKIGWHLIKNYNVITMNYHFIVNGNPIPEEDRKRIVAAWDTAEQFATLAWQIHQHEAQNIFGALTGDVDSVNQLGAEYQMAMAFSVEIIETIDEELSNID